MIVVEGVCAVATVGTITAIAAAIAAGSSVVIGGRRRIRARGL